MSYLKHWNLQRSPFSIQGNRRAVYTGGTVEEAFSRSEFVVNQGKQLALVIGPSGCGKTTLLEHIAYQRNSQHPRESMIRLDLKSSHYPSLSGRMADALGLTRTTDSNPWGAVQDHLFSASAIGRRTVLIFDNVRDIDDEMVETLSSLLCSKMPWCTFLSVDDETLVNLPLWILEHCELKIELPAWDLAQTADYFEFVIARQGGRDNMFDGQSMTRIHELGDGIPRKISKIAELALVAGAIRNAECVTSELVEQVCNEFTFTVGAKFPTIWDVPQLNAR